MKEQSLLSNYQFKHNDENKKKPVVIYADQLSGISYFFLGPSTGTTKAQHTTLKVVFANGYTVPKDCVAASETIIAGNPTIVKAGKPTIVKSNSNIFPAGKPALIVAGTPIVSRPGKDSGPNKINIFKKNHVIALDQLLLIASDRGN